MALVRTRRVIGVMEPGPSMSLILSLVCFSIQWLMSPRTASGAVTEIDQVKAGGVIGSDKREEARAEVFVLLRPECVGNVQFVAGVRGIHLAEQLRPWPDAGDPAEG